MSGIAVICNPNSRQNIKNPKAIPRLREVLGERGRLFATNNLEALDEAVIEVQAMAPDLICMNGGDGTNHATVSALAKV